MKQKRSLSFRMLPLVLATACYVNISEATVTYLGSGTLGNPDVSGLTGTLEDGTAENQISTGSGFAYTGYGNRFVGIPDRGPNASTYNAAVDNTTSYISRAEEVDIAITPDGSGGWTITPTLMKTTLFHNATPLTGTATASNPDKTYFTGLSSGFDATNSSDSMRLDPESIRISRSGNSFYVSDEYGPFINEFDRTTGLRLRSFAVPAKFTIANPDAIGNNEIASNTSGRVANKGMEGLAITPDGTTLYGIMQSPLLQDHALDSKGKKLGIYNRILKIDIATGATQEFVYPLSDKSYTVSDMVAINDHEFLVDERDGSGGTSAVKKTFYKIDVTGATDVSSVASLPASGTIAGVTTVTKSATPFLDMLDPAFGLAGTSFPEKIEGITFGPDLPDGRHTLVITNDNDFIPGNPNIFFVFAVDAADLDYVPQTVDHTVQPLRARNDFDDSGKSDVLFLDSSSGATRYWVDANKAQTVSAGNYSMNYTYQGSGDFNGDGNDDLFFTRNADNATLIWHGADKTAASYPGAGPAGFSVAVICDVDGDSQDDVIWYNASTGATRVWSGASKASVTYPGTQNLAYTVAACADFDGDGKADLFWHDNTNGANQVWLAGSKARKYNPGKLADVTWVPVGAGDVDGDGQADLVWYHTSNGATQLWKAGLKSTASYPGTGAGGFTPKAVGDYDGDGKADLLWGNDSTQALRLWSAMAKSSATYLGTAPAGFAVQK